MPRKCDGSDVGAPCVTIIGGLICSDHVLLAADSWAADASGAFRENVEKIWQSGSMAWGFSGDAGLGGRFNERWHNVQPPSTWDELVGRLSAEVNGLNRVAREQARAAGTEADDRQLLTVLLGGYVGGQARIIETAVDGRAEFVGDHAFIGSGALVAEIAFGAIAAYAGGFPKDGDAFRTVMDHAMKWDRKNCGPPIQIIRIGSV